MTNNKVIKMVIFAIIIGASLLFFGIKVFDFGIEDNEIKNDEEDYTEEIIDNEIKNDEETNIETDYDIVTPSKVTDYEVVLNSNGVDVMTGDIIKWSDNAWDKLELANITITGFTLDGKDSKVQLNNLPSSADCVRSGMSKDVLINGKKVLSWEHEGCYIVRFNSVFVLNDKYVGISYSGEGPTVSLVIYDNTGNKVYEKDDVLDFRFSDYTFKTYAENDKNYILNNYKLIESDGIISEKLLSLGNESFCDMLCAEALPCCEIGE